jgi:enediyne biosynthesis protein E5
MSTGNPDVPTTTPPMNVAPQTGRRFRFDNRFLAPVLITCILAIADYQYQILESYWHTAAAIVSAIALELILGRWVTGRWPHLASAYITGISVGILMRSTQWWPFILCSLLSISSKYALRFQGRHLWNPSNLGMSVLLFLAPGAASSLSQQMGNEIWPLLVIWLLGVIILYRLGRLHITLTYVAAFIALSFVRSAVSGAQWITEVAPLTAPMYQLYIFFMITDPATTTRTWRRQCAVALLVAVVETILRLNEIIYAPYYALFIVSPPTNLLEIWWTARPVKANDGTLVAGPPSK